MADRNGKTTPGSNRPKVSRRRPDNERVRRAAATVLPKQDIGSTLEDLTAGDHLILSMRERGETWPSILRAYASLTGQTPAESTLPNRYYRIQAALRRFTVDDDKCLLSAKEGVEGVFESEKWGMVAEAMGRMGGIKMNAAMCKRRFEEICMGREAGGGAADGGSSGGDELVGGSSSPGVLGEEGGSEQDEDSPRRSKRRKIGEYDAGTMASDKYAINGEELSEDDGDNGLDDEEAYDDEDYRYMRGEEEEEM